jgi:hypothetical protein
MKYIKRFFYDYGVTITVLYVLHYMGWIALYPASGPWETLNTAAIVGLPITVVLYLSWNLYWSFEEARGFSGLGCLSSVVLVIVNGYAALWLVAHFLPEYMTLTSSIWVVILAAFILNFTRIIVYRDKFDQVRSKMETLSIR